MVKRNNCVAFKDNPRKEIDNRIQLNSQHLCTWVSFSVIQSPFCLLEISLHLSLLFYSQGGACSIHGIVAVKGAGEVWVPLILWAPPRHCYHENWLIEDLPWEGGPRSRRKQLAKKKERKTSNLNLHVKPSRNFWFGVGCGLVSIFIFLRNTDITSWRLLLYVTEPIPIRREEWNHRDKSTNRVAVLHWRVFG